MGAPFPIPSPPPLNELFNSPTDTLADAQYPPPPPHVLPHPLSFPGGRGTGGGRHLAQNA